MPLHHIITTGRTNDQDERSIKSEPGLSSLIICEYVNLPKQPSPKKGKIKWKTKACTILFTAM
jgi:hypothetical protein